MRILFIHNKYLQRGGEDTTVEAEMNLMRSKGHDVQMLLFDNATIGKGVLARARSALSSIYSRSSAAMARNAIKTFRPDIVHVHNFYFTASPSVIVEAHNMMVPVVVTVQNYRTICANCHLLRDNKVCELCVPHRFPWYGVKYKCYHNSAIHSAVVGSIAAMHKIAGTWNKKVSRYITPASFTKDRLLNSSLHVPAAKFAVKRNFIPDPGEGEVERSDFYLFVGRLSGEKGVDTALEAFKYSPERKLLIAGDGPEMTALKTLYGNFGNIEFLGLRDRTEILSLMKRARALIFPSKWYEGLPLTIVEAFATGTPVIASSLGAMKEMVQNGVNGLLFEAGDSNSLVSQLNTFEASDTRAFSKGARQSYLNLYNPEICYTEIMKIYSDVLSNHSR